MKRTLSAILCAALCLVFALAGAARADVVKPNDDFYYYDDAGVMTDATRAMIYYNNVELQKACGAQIVVAAVKTLDGLTREDYAYRLINEWGVGDKTENNGAVLLLAIDEDDYCLTTGTGLERHLDAGTVKTILDEYLEPDFASKNYDDGVRKTFEAIFTRVNSAYRAGVTFQSAYNWETTGDSLPSTTRTNPQTTETVKKQHKGGGGMSVIFVLIVLFIVMRSFDRCFAASSAPSARSRGSAAWEAPDRAPRIMTTTIPMAPVPVPRTSAASVASAAVTAAASAAVPAAASAAAVPAAASAVVPAAASAAAAVPAAASVEPAAVVAAAEAAEPDAADNAFTNSPSPTLPD